MKIRASIYKINKNIHTFITRKHTQIRKTHTPIREKEKKKKKKHILNFSIVFFRLATLSFAVGAFTGTPASIGTGSSSSTIETESGV